MCKMILTILFTCVCFIHQAYAIEKYPVDVCFMIADLKYNAKQGVKICEIQQASLSLFNGDEFRSAGDVSIYKELLHTLSLYNENGWVVANSLADRNIAHALAESSLWRKQTDLLALFSNHDFMGKARLSAGDLYDVSSYQGFLYVNRSHLYVLQDYERRLPGIIVIDKSSFPFWIDKYAMTNLFTQDEVLSTFKPKWGNYKKTYTPQLAEQIINDLQCDTFVIKPRGEFLGNGVIIVQKDDLDEVLYFITTKTGKFANSRDPAYMAWKRDPFDTFIVEEFVASDPIVVPHLENKVYQPTMRVAFLLVYNKHCHNVHFLGGYWKTPPLSLDEEGDFMKKNKDICKPPYYSAVDPKIMEVVEEDLRIALPLLHMQMLHYQPDASLQEQPQPLEKGLTLRFIPKAG